MLEVSCNLKNKEELYRNLPVKPGVYQFLNSKKEIIYIGKAKSLLNRIRSYFSESNLLSSKVKNMVFESKYLDFTITNSELEAFLLEQRQIKTYKPKFNVQFKDDKGYPWIKISTELDFPSARSFLGKKDEESLYLGPFPSSYAVKEVLSLLQKQFKIKNCTEIFFKNRRRPCLQYQIGKCSAPCVNLISKEEYKEELDLAILLLNGKSEDLLKNLYAKMDSYSKLKKFEKAAEIRDKISSLRDIQRKQSVSGYKSERDAIYVLSMGSIKKVGITHVKDGWITGHENFTQGKGAIEDEALESFIKDYYFSSENCPDFIISNLRPNDIKGLEAALSKRFQKKIRILSRLGSKDRGLLEISKRNTKASIKKRSSRVRDLNKSFLSLSESLKINNNLNNIICFDISHFSGKEAVGGVVFYSSKGPIKSRYRLFNISAENSGNDYGSMEEVLLRYFTTQKNFLTGNSLVILDGGKALQELARKILNNKGLKDICIISIAKGARRRASFDVIHTKEGKIAVDRANRAHLLIQEIRDEAHRFSITKQKRKQIKSTIRSSLDSIAGIGRKKRESLLRHFGSVEQIKRASVEDIMEVRGVGRSLSNNILKRLK